MVIPYLDYRDILHDQDYNSSLHEKLESFQYFTISIQFNCLVLAGAIRNSSKEKMYQELCFETLRVRRWYRKL